MIFILEGLSFLFAAAVLFMLSFQVAVWLGIYHYEWAEHKEEMSRSLQEIKFKVRMSHYRIFLRYFFFLLPFFQGVVPQSIPISIIVGILFGLFIDFCVYVARRRQGRINVRRLAQVVLLLIVLFSSQLFAAGVWDIVLVWEMQTDPKKDEWWFYAMVVSLIVELLTHAGFWWYAKKQLLASPAADETQSKRIMSPNRPRMAFSLIAEKMEKRKADELAALHEEESATPALPSVREEPDAEEGSAEVGDNEGNKEEPNADSPVEETNSDSPEEEATKEQKVVEDDANGSNPHEDEEDDEFNRVHTCKEMFWRHWQLCGCVRGDDRSRLIKTLSFMSWTIWFTLVGFSLWLVIVNMGATRQQVAAREKLPYVYEALYRYIDEGPVCAFDNRGADSNITTFENKNAANESGFLVLHCGACAACSDWHNLRLEYTTRNYLADESFRCARKSLTGGRAAVLECLKQEPIGFQGKCAECWVDDILCTKGFCAFIFLQSTMINAVSDLQVNADTISSAACEEAHCEAGNPGNFVSCSGATRRRMNVTSTISRPGSQRCGIVDVDWAELFPEEE